MRQIGFLLALVACISHAQNLATSSDPRTWSSLSGVSITAGISDPDGGTNAYRVTATAATTSALHVQSGLTPGKFIRHAMYVKSVAGNSAGVNVRLFYGEKQGVSQNVTGVVTTSWQRIRSNLWQTNDASGFYGVQLTGATAGDAFDIYSPDLRYEVFNKNVIAVGDSYFTYPDHGPHYLELVSNYNVWSKGTGGQRCDQMRARLNDDAIIHRPALILIGTCINDIVADRSAATIMSYVQSMLDAAAAAGIKVVIITPTPFNNSTSWTSGRQTVFDQLTTLMLAKDNGSSVRVYDSRDSCSDGATPPGLTAACDGGDHLHRSTTGYGVQARGIAAHF